VSRYSNPKTNPITAISASAELRTTMLNFFGLDGTPGVSAGSTIMMFEVCDSAAQCDPFIRCSTLS